MSSGNSTRDGYLAEEAGCSKDSTYCPDSPIPDEPRASTSQKRTSSLGKDYEEYCQNTSHCPEEEEPEDDDRIRELTDKVRGKLIMNRQMDKLSDYLDIKLAECGWKIDLRNILRDKVKEGSSPTLEELYNLVKDRAQTLVPRQIRKEMIYKIHEGFNVEIPESEEDTDDSYDST